MIGAFSKGAGRAAALVVGLAAASNASAELAPVTAQPEEVLAAALTTICIPEVFDGVRMEETTAQAGLAPVSPRAIGSTLNFGAWEVKLRDNKAYIERIKPSFGCSIAVQKGDAAALQTQALTLLGARTAFEPRGQSPVRSGRAMRSAYCSAGPNPYVVSVVTSDKSRPVFVLNVFRADSPFPSFCAAPA